ncbi:MULTISPECIES: helix-turn-helix domain-containing protein [Streptomyces]|uniref:helix-turn-helix domain-containing protein n=1 Tax=Streptomyces TaxID=1883 RepID=UPI0004BF1A2B|nr:MULTISPECIES: helix-turn-helix domain-containing protein [Streptomyces]KOG82258.1 DNA-binding protein [Streptomyces griseus subsp. rhodochrous]MBD3543871.1 helix-turn-helix domain-containing protein [Streptomyces sp. JV180]MBD3550664.1 helix-turn-helix domain-containing protein [Streptomyces sp. SP18CM02]
MNEKVSVESLLEEARLAKAMPPPAERLRLREAAGLTRDQVARAVGVARGTVQNWERGASEPTPPGRLEYLRLLEGLAQLYPAPEAPGDPVAELLAAAKSSTPQPPAPGVAPPVPAALTGLETLRGPDGRAIEGDPGPCVRCGVETTYQSTDGRPLHSGAMCQPTAPAVPPTPPTSAPALAPVSAPASASPVPARVSTRPQRRSKSAERAQEDLLGMIRDAVREEAERAGGDEEAAVAALEKRAVPDVMDLFAETRSSARYEYTAYPTLPDILHKPTKKRPDEIWEARPRFRHPGYSMRAARADVRVTALDTNAAYLSSMKCWLPIGRLEHTTGADGVNPKRAGVHLITPAQWAHPYLPDPIGDRDEPGALWVTDATLRLLLRLSGSKYGLTGAPEIHESWTSGATENFLDALRKALAAARDEALTTRDVLLEMYVKSMYSKFVSTMGESDTNRKIYRPDWMHIVRAQAHANLWSKAYKAHQGGLEVIAMLGTDELHVTGDPWSVFTEGRALSQMKVKYTDAKASGEYMVGKVKTDG